MKTVSVLIAGGGTAGHIEPALATADALRRLNPNIRITALGTARGLETTLIPERGYELVLVPAVPLPRKPSKDLLLLPFRLWKSIRATRAIIEERQVDVVVGFGGYVCLPAYLAARRRVPVVVHEANARAGIANKIGARFAAAVVAAVPGSGLRSAKVIGIPVRRSISILDRAGLRAEARKFFGLDPDAPTLLVYGGSQGAVRINDSVLAAAPELAAAGVGVLHAFGKKNSFEAPTNPGPAYVAVAYLDRMDMAYAAADLTLGRSGALTVAELGAVGMPAVYVPLPHGNGEQRLNASAQVAAGSAIIIDDAELTRESVVAQVLPLLTDPAKREAMAAAATASPTGRADAVLATIVANLGAEHAAGRGEGT
ncbi:undecaprenyldiphospho-muramoylpentapeptide beta-N-acetylglucosaminyltransferase [Nakamurella antarctica]|uniref:UDP-N-acetylglucosamine--N-acetylmuramyl-(pentapeptide) pyrophosphoryl-undecaprenol N-acetylglucosamine transferase n=1 Tax=Nakamurella antarctica TaxID=1902245 RepID=A0A3G8ZKF1_9ACTN|nr:undecaprenyldiphospho-muramoylpentapeptide beta-N-acetylglucosaminyltransferase [Nakamurella antarctica]AZI57668.1 undecaprenyldiphospho-muramoylpentapeptide beta-N-acetylglucosaminyltransferase [Nakamurella antarctica]